MYIEDSKTGYFGNIKEGLLHKKLGIPEADKIPLALLRKKLKEAQKAGNTKLIEEIVFAINSKTKFHHR